MAEETSRQQIFVRVSGTLIAAGVIGAFKILIWDGRWPDAWDWMLANRQTSGGILLGFLLIVALRWIKRRSSKKSGISSDVKSSPESGEDTLSDLDSKTAKMVKKRAKLDLKMRKKGR